MFFSRALCLSLLLHALFFALLFFRVAPKAISPPTVFVELPAIPGESPSAPASRSRAGRKSGGISRALPRGWSTRPKIWEKGGGVGGGQEAAPRRGRGDAAYSFGAKMNLAQEGKFHPFARKLYDRIDSYLGYPPDFVEENIEGSVTLHFLVDARGKFLGRFLEVEGDSRNLNIYAMAMIALALKEPLVNVMASESEIPIALRIDFRLLLPDEFATRSAVNNFKNTLSFERIAFTEPKATKQMRRIVEKYMPPIIPVPGGFFIDFVLLHKRLTEKDSDDPDWRRGIRMELDQELLEQVIKRSAS